MINRYVEADMDRKYIQKIGEMMPWNFVGLFC